MLLKVGYNPFAYLVSSDRTGNIGRETMQCSPDSIDDTVPPANVPELELDEQEYCNHRNFVHLIRLVKNIRRMVDVHVKLKEHPSWRNDPQFMKSAPSLDKWLSELPPDLLVEVNPDLNEPSPDVGNSHFTGNMQVYYHLARTMLHRPALAYGKTFTAEGEWRHHMSICSNSAKAICRLEEVIFRDYGMLGLQCMNRGVNFSIYTLLTGAMIHLVWYQSLCTIVTLLTSSRSQLHALTRNSITMLENTLQERCGYSRTVLTIQHLRK